MLINQIRPLPISVEHALGVSALPPHHRDPFDRLLVAQAKTENIPLLSADAILKPYSIQMLW
jgi:PIN domain nuclease of toxin-antitoxin system